MAYSVFSTSDILSLQDIVIDECNLFIIIVIVQYIVAAKSWKKTLYHCQTVMASSDNFIPKEWPTQSAKVYYSINV